MKWKYFPLPSSDSRAREQVLLNLEMGAAEHTLSKKILSRFANATGSLIAVAFESLDLDAPWLYAYGSYAGGKGWAEAAGTQHIPQSDSPMGGMVLFVQDFLRASEDAVVLGESWLGTRTAFLTDGIPRESRMLFHGEEVYHILTSEDDNYDSIESAIRESGAHFAVGVCSSYPQARHLQDASEEFLDRVATNTKHIFVPAFDGEGYLVWSPFVPEEQMMGPTGDGRPLFRPSQGQRPA